MRTDKKNPGGYGNSIMNAAVSSIMKSMGSHEDLDGKISQLRYYLNSFSHADLKITGTQESKTIPNLDKQLGKIRSELVSCQNKSPEHLFSLFIPTFYDLSTLLDDYSICPESEDQPFMFPPTLLLVRESVQLKHSNSLVLVDYKHFLTFYAPPIPLMDRTLLEWLWTLPGLQQARNLQGQVPEGIRQQKLSSHWQTRVTRLLKVLASMKGGTVFEEVVVEVVHRGSGEPGELMIAGCLFDQTRSY